MAGYFYIDTTTSQQQGPFSPNDLKNQNIKQETMVWCSGMNDWTEAKNIKELDFLFNINIPEPPINISNTNNNDGGNSEIKSQEGSFAKMTPNYRPNYTPTQQTSTSYRPNLNKGLETRPIPKNWLVESILVTICCCLPFGIAGIVYATKVETLYYSGDYEAAEQASKDAKKWTTIGFFSSFIFIALYFILVFFAGLSSAIF